MNILMDRVSKVSKKTKKCQKSADLEEFFIKNQGYFCKKCDYNSSHKSHFRKHLKSSKHLKNSLLVVSKKVPKCQNLYNCKYCEKTYKSKSGYYKHMKICENIMNVKKKADEEVKKQLFLKEQELKRKEKQINEKDEQITKFVGKMANDVEEMKNAIMKSQSIQNTTNNIQKQENYNTININIFLNEHCKNAMNLQDFVDKIKYKLDDVMAINALGYEKGMANVMLKNLKDMPVTERPIHCSDSKEGVFHVKDEGEWHQENNGLEPGSKTFAIAKQLRTKGILAIKEWEAANPNWPYDDKLGKERLCLFDILAGGCDAKELENSHIEFLKKVGDEVKIEDAINEIN